MKEIIGVTNKLLEIDLTMKKWQVLNIDPKDRRMYLGGKGLGLKIYYDRFKSKLNDIDTLGSENDLIFMAGVLTGTGAVCSARFAGVTKSPLTGIMVSSSCGGPFGGAFKTAGYDGLIIKGTSSSPLYLEISDGEVLFHDASQLWGKMIDETQNIFNLSANDGDLTIGPAGENKVSYANIASGHRFLGRAGMGAVMGSKKLKAIVVRGRSYRVRPVKEEMFKTVRRKASAQIARNDFAGKYRKYGTNSNVIPGISAGYVPVTNFRYRTDERFKNLSGEVMAEKYQTKTSSCSPCSIQCGHKGTYSDGIVKQIPEYETIGLWGPNIDNYDADKIGEWNLLMNRLGLDTISAGGTISWAMEAGEKGLRKTVLKFGKTDNIGTILSDIAYQRGEGEDLGLGSAFLSRKYGGADFAIQVKGLEMAAYDPRGAWGQGLSYAVANRGACHLSAYPLALEVLFGFLNPYSTRSKAFWVDFFENFNAALNSLQTCQFTAFAYIMEPPLVRYTPNFLLKIAMQYLPWVAALVLDFSVLNKTYESITGISLSMKDYMKAGKRIHVLERYINTQMGISSKDDTLPDRFLNEADTNHSVKKTVNLKPMVDKYYKIKGYNSEGIPKDKTLSSLGIQK
ncbi:MAG: aldehyde ferredoxin oxidoreductase family protein [Spirochaetaceae bacterium]|nr:aldehyde ferredoxin oxidoreductase family protein [Spirochaetaceae bacterium]